MCRLAAIPPGVGRHETLEILDEMEGKNVDGFGYTYVNESGEFVTKKYVMPFSMLIKRGIPILAHLPVNSWTIIHMRAASRGVPCRENSHPFIIKDGNNIDKWSICHNGTWKDHNFARFILGKKIHFNGETDSEVAAHVINIVSPKQFALSTQIEWGAGVYLCLNKNGSLEVIKSSGDLKFHVRENNKVLIASELKWDYKSVEAPRGWFKFNANGNMVEHEKREWGNCSSSSSIGTTKVYGSHNLPSVYQGGYHFGGD